MVLNDNAHDIDLKGCIEDDQYAILASSDVETDLMKFITVVSDRYDPNQVTDECVIKREHGSSIRQKRVTDSSQQRRLCGVVKEPTVPSKAGHRQLDTGLLQGLTLRTSGGDEYRAFTSPDSACQPPGHVGDRGSSSLTRSKKRPLQKNSYHPNGRPKKQKPSKQYVPKACVGFLFLLTCCGKTNARATQHIGHPACSTSGAVFVGDSAEITCHFRNDVRQHRLHFGLVRYDFGGLDPVEDLVLSCLWKGNQDDPTCIIDDGYSFDPTWAGESVTINIEKTHWTIAGSYQCREGGTPVNQGQLCPLTVKGSSISCETSPARVLTGQPARVSCLYNSDLRRSGEDFYIHRFDGDNSQPVEVLFCKWARPGGTNQLDCEVHPDYVFDKANISTVVTLHIGSAAVGHSGRYVCLVLPYHKRVTTTECALGISGTTTPVPTTAVAAFSGPRSPGTEAALADTRCGSQILVPRGKAAALLCSIPQHFHRENVTVRMDRITRNGNVEAVEEVLSCNESSCKPKDGYQLIQRSADSITVQVTKVTEHHEGKYACTYFAHSYVDSSSVCLQLLKNDPVRNLATGVHQLDLSVGRICFVPLMVLSILFVG